MQQTRTRVGKYELGRTLGEGAFSKVRFARNMETGEGVAIKVLDKYKVLQNKMIDQVSTKLHAIQGVPPGAPQIMSVFLRFLQNCMLFKGFPPGAPQIMSVFSRFLQNCMLFKGFPPGAPQIMSVFSRFLQNCMLFKGFPPGAPQIMSVFSRFVYGGVPCRMTHALPKVLEATHYEGYYSKEIKREISTMQLIKHPNVVQLHEVMASKTKIYIVLDFVTGGELFDKINDLGKLKEGEARRYFQQLINAVDYCHSRGVYHRDLKPENLLLDTFGNLKVSDFGLSALSRDIKSDGLLHTTCGTPNYVAPEVISGKGYDGRTADLWSCGVILFVFLAGYLPFDESNIIALYRKINKAEFRIPKQLSPGAKSLILRILDPNTNTRITMAEILKDVWFVKGYKPPKFPKEDVTPDDIHAIFNDSEEYHIVEKKETQFVLRNAFELITMSQGLDLGILFEKPMGIVKREKRFISKESPNNIVSKIEEAVIPLGFNVQKQNHKMKLHCVKAGRKGNLAIVTEVIEIAPSLVMVNFQKTAGDTLEFQEFYKNLTPGLQDVVWSSQSNIEDNNSA